MSDTPVKLVKEHAAYSNRFITVYDDFVTMPNGKPGRYLRIVESEGRPGVAILPITDKAVGLVKTFRYALQQWEWSIPRGFASSVDPRETAQHELSEELGGVPIDLMPLGVISPNSGILAGKVHLFLAHYAAEVSNPADTHEIHGVRWLSYEELRAEIALGNVSDSFTLSALSLAILSRKLDLGS